MKGCRRKFSMKKIIILCCIFFLMVGCNSSKEGLYQTISPKDVYDMKSELDVVIIDVRTISEYATGYIENAINIPLDKISTVEDSVPDKNKKVIVYCKTGNRSKQAAEQLIKMGYKNVYDMKGLDSWEYELKK